MLTFFSICLVQKHFQKKEKEQELRVHAGIFVKDFAMTILVELRVNELTTNGSDPLIKKHHQISLTLHTRR